MLRSSCILLVLTLWAYSPNFSSFHKFKAKLACCQVSAIYLVNCHFPFLGLWCFITPLPSHQNASFWLRFIPRLFSTTPPNFIRIRNLRAELECRTVRMFLCNYFAYFHCAFICNCALYFVSAAAFGFPAAVDYRFCVFPLQWRYTSSEYYLDFGI